MLQALALEIFRKLTAFQFIKMSMVPNSLMPFSTAAFTELMSATSAVTVLLLLRAGFLRLHQFLLRSGDQDHIYASWQGQSNSFSFLFFRTCNQCVLFLNQSFHSI
jgi:hypothetical protein